VTRPRAEALVGPRPSLVFDTVGTMWDPLCRGAPPTLAEWTAVRLALTNAYHASKEAATLLYESLGTTGVFRKSPLDRQRRDAATMAQHVLVQTKTYDNCGRSLLGLDPGGLAFS
jgi:hypothetical protein